MEEDLVVTSNDDLNKLLDNLLIKKDREWWTKFYTNKEIQCPFFVNKPDENLVEFIDSGIMYTEARILELGCGNGRNSIWLAEKGFEVDGIDFSASAIESALHKIEMNKKLKVNFYCESIFEHPYKENEYDLVYDCGCFHHISPHRRTSYIDILMRSLKRKGYFLLVCFNEKGGSGLSDLQVYEERSLKGGLAYNETKIGKIFEKSFDIKQIREMKEEDEGSRYFGKNFLVTSIMQKC